MRSPLVPVLALGALLLAVGCNNDKLESGAHPTDPPVDTPTETPTQTPPPTPTPSPLPDKGAIAGQVCSPAGNVWLSGANVWVVQDDGSSDTTTTDANGQFLLQNVDVGNRTLDIQKGSFSTTQAVTVTANQTTTLATPTCVQSAHVAVVMGDWDAIQNILGAVGVTDVTLYDGVNGTSPTVKDLLTNSTLMATYDIIFINCGDYIDRYPNLFNSQVVANLQNYVAAGGSLYASDWAYDFVEIAWPSAIDFYGNDGVRGAADDGVYGSLTANVADPALAATLGSSSVSLDYNLDIWAVMKSAGAGTNVLVKGDPYYYDDFGFPEDMGTVPLAVWFPVGSNGGSVLYTTFHNESQATTDMQKILSYMIFQL